MHGRRAAAGTVVAAALLVAFAVVLPHGFALSQRTLSRPLVVPDTPVPAVYLEVLLAVMLTLAAATTVVLAGRTRGAPARPVRRRMPLWMQLLFVGLCAAAAVAIQRVRGSILARHLPGGAGRPPRQAAEALGHTSSHVFGVALTAGLVLLTVALAVGLYLLLRRPHAEARLRAPPESDLAAATSAALEELAEGDDPRAAVINCYVRMRAALAAAGISPRPSDTPHEFLARTLSARGAPPDACRTLTELFEAARFGPHPVTEAMRARATDALQRIRAGVDDRVAERA